MELTGCHRKVNLVVDFSKKKSGYYTTVSEVFTVVTIKFWNFFAKIPYSNRLILVYLVYYWNKTLKIEYLLSFSRYFLMKNCWEPSATARPTFSLLLKQLEYYVTRLTQNGVKFEYLLESSCWWRKFIRGVQTWSRNVISVKKLILYHYLYHKKVIILYIV